ncbi:FecCD family ABC transporter permease [Gandjariella thermophila]|uniref:Iron ABC transporter n=1 Tax=Gandjariella thermophila TaxID=1931992 RepID=A0A4D4J804_9PSEU|nr:iron chelate uptake ABC transporter family permease subunit [Gandjariella thermophila]GDY30788.1 iron ABC transporter [Gandjariella thermophila]
MTSTVDTVGTRVPGRRGVRLGPASWVLRPRLVVVCLTGLAALVLLVAVNVGLGDFPIGVPDVLRVLAGGGSHAQRYIVLELRLPRTLTGALVGAALGVSGAIVQAVARNPLASPDILGVTWGAGAGAVAVIAVAGSYGGISGLASTVGLPVAALGGGTLAGFAVHLLAWRRGLEGYRLVLVGVAVSTALANLTYWLLTVGNVTEASRAMAWITGSLNGRGWTDLLPVAAALGVLLPASLLGVAVLGALQLDDDTVGGLGVRAGPARAALVLAAVLLASVATAAAGPVTFVALAVPQVAMRLAGLAQPPLLASAVFGAALTIGADVLARTAFPVELPVGVVTAALGAPYLMYLLARRARA